MSNMEPRYSIIADGSRLNRKSVGPAKMTRPTMLTVRMMLMLDR